MRYGNAIFKFGVCRRTSDAALKRIDIRMGDVCGVDPTRLGVCEPHCARQRCTIENTQGLVRQYPARGPGVSGSDDHAADLHHGLSQIRIQRRQGEAFTQGQFEISGIVRRQLEAPSQLQGIAQSP